MDILNATRIYDAYWEFAYKRQEVFYARFNGKPKPWSDDLILQKYKFTNAYRIADRVSQYLVKNIIYNGNHYSEEDQVFRILLFKFFNRIETWQALENSFGEIKYSTYNRMHYEQVLGSLIEAQIRIYSAAYIVPSGKSSFGYKEKYKNNLSLIELIMKEKFSIKIARMRSLKELYETLLSYPTIGKFLAFQYAIDINYSEICDFSEMSFVIAGPGAQSGIEKCFNQIKYNYENIIRFVTEHQEDEFNKRGLQFKMLFGRPLQLIDCQNLFCETDKYARVAFPSKSSETERTRIKQKFKENTKPVEYFFPPKWGLKY